MGVRRSLSETARGQIPVRKRVLRILGQVCAILAITLALDYILLATVFSDWKRNWADAATAYTQAYVRVPWHHDLAPNQNSMRPWGKILYPFRTDRYGFRTGTCAPGEGDKSKPAIFVIGDSFTEGLGVPYEETFAGLMACDAAKEGKAVWNLGVLSFSPVIYHRKIRAAAEKLGIKPAEIYVFLDMSDITDEAIVYRDERGRHDHDGTVIPLVRHRPVPVRQLRDLPAAIQSLARHAVRLGGARRKLALKSRSPVTPAFKGRRLACHELTGPSRLVALRSGS